MKRKILTSAAGLAILTVLVMGSQIGGDTKKASATTPNIKTAQTASTTATNTSVSSPTEVQSTEGASAKVSTNTNSSSVSAPDSTTVISTPQSPEDICANAKLAIQQIQDSYIVPNQQLQNGITTNKNILMSISSSAATRGGIVTPDEQAQITQANKLYQLDGDLLMANMQKMNQELTPYQQQLTANACNS